jgi:hypothetical protein
MLRQAVCLSDSGKFEDHRRLTMTTQSITSITDGQKKPIKRFVEDAVDRAIAESFLDKDGIQKLIENGDKFQARIITGIKELSVSNQFADEEVKSSYAYPQGYKVKGITEQTDILRQLFPGISFAGSWPRVRFPRTPKGGSPSRSGRRSRRPTVR